MSTSPSTACASTSHSLSLRPFWCESRTPRQSAWRLCNGATCLPRDGGNSIRPHCRDEIELSEDLLRAWRISHRAGPRGQGRELAEQHCSAGAVSVVQTPLPVAFSGEAVTPSRGHLERHSIDIEQAVLHPVVASSTSHHFDGLEGRAAERTRLQETIASPHPRSGHQCETDEEALDEDEP